MDEDGEKVGFWGKLSTDLHQGFFVIFDWNFTCLAKAKKTDQCNRSTPYVPYFMWNKWICIWLRRRIGLNSANICGEEKELEIMITLPLLIHFFGFEKKCNMLRWLFSPIYENIIYHNWNLCFFLDFLINETLGVAIVHKLNSRSCLSLFELFHYWVLAYSFIFVRKYLVLNNIFASVLRSGKHNIF